MLVTIEIKSKKGTPKKQDIQKNIDALERVLISNTTSAHDTVLILDTLSILKGIQKKLPELIYD